MRSISYASAAPTAQARAPLPNTSGQDLPPLGFELFTIVEAPDGTIWVQNHGGREHRAE